jgi:hypothetical protein
MPNKFKIGDKVIIKRDNGRTAKELLENLRLDHPRTITAVFYDEKTQHTRYYLGTNKRGDVDLSFLHLRSCELILWDRGRVGRPRAKRRYKKRMSNPQGITATL